MSTCRWCTPLVLSATELLQKYCSGQLLADEERALNEDLCFCLDCVVEYHRARDELPSLHKRLWELEISRLLARFSQVSEEELEDDLLIVEDEQEIHVPKITGAEFENFLRVPLTEVLRYPYLMAHPKLCDMCVDALCKMEKSNSLQVFEKLQGIYLLLVHPNEEVRRWAIRTAKSLGKVDRDDFYDLKDVFCSMFRVLDLDLFHNSDVYSYIPENSKNALLPHHLYDAKNPKDYWLGICMLLTQLDAQAMDSLLLGPDKQTEIIQCIVKTMENTTEDESSDPFWPSLQCFMVILDRLGSKIWGQLIEPTCPFQTITGSPSYTAEIENIRRNTMFKVKVEMEPDDDFVTCSQIIYDCNTKEKQVKFVDICTQGSSVIYEEMQSLVSVLQLDMGKDMRVHNSTFLWFIPFVQSVMDLNNHSIVYIGEIIHYLCEEIKDLISGRIQTCDKVTEFFTFILVFIIELHLSKQRMNVLYYSVPKWVEVIVKCALLPSAAFSRGFDSGSHCVSSTTSSSWNSRVNTAVPQACMQIIRSLLREGGKLSSHGKAMHYLNLLNKQIREAPQKHWKLETFEAKELQNCLKQLVKLMKDNHSATASNTDSVSTEMLPPNSSNDSFGSNEDCKQLLKKESTWDNVHCNLTEQNNNYNVNMKMMKKEPLSPEHNHIETKAEVKPPFLLSGKFSDPGKLQLIKSKLGPSLQSKLQGIAKQQSDCNITNVSSEQQSILDRSSIEHCENFAEYEVVDTSIPLSSDVKRSEKQVKNLPSSIKSDDSENSDNVPLSILKGQLKRKQKLKHTDICDINISENCPVGSSLDSSKPLRKTKPKAASSQVNSDLRIVEPISDVIVISDTESIENDDTSVSWKKETECLFRKEIVTLKCDSPNQADTGKNSSYTDDISEYDSQLFEFETQDDMFSEWTDSQIGSGELASATKETSPGSSKPKMSRGTKPCSTLGYDTDPISDENLENVLLRIEEQQKKQTDAVVPKRNYGKGTTSTAKASFIKNGEGNTFKKGLGILDKTERETEKSLSTIGSRQTLSSRTPAIVPPKKERKPVEPVSPAEKLGLIKRKRKAFEFSQRSTACIKKLRKHGQGVHVEQKQWTQRGKKSKLITPQKLNIRGHRKLLASQDLQYFRQSRGKLHSLHSEAENKLTAERGPMETKLPKISNTKIHIPKPNVADGEDVFLPSLPLRHDPMTDGGARTAGQSLQDKPSFSEINSTESRPSSSTIIEDENLHADQVQSSKSLLTNSLIDAITSTVNNKCDDMSIAQEDGDTSDLTQNDPVDMEICSQMEEEDDIFLTQRDPVDMDIDLESQICPENKSEERVSTSHPGDDHIFLKPGISPSPLKKSKPPTTKIYASSSRSETLVQEMKKTASKPLPVGAKSKIRPSLPVKNTSTPQSDSSLFRQLVPLTTPVSLRPHSFQSGPVGSSLQVPTYKTYARPEAPVVKAMPHNDTGPKFDQAYLIKAILKWNYEMFFSYSQFGIPSDLCHFQLKEVANNYRSYDEYFGTFYPLLLINTFEEVCGHMYLNSLLNFLMKREKSMVRCMLVIKNILNITIQTYGNVSSVNNQSVKCELVGSLVSAIREFKALCFLKNNPMVRALLVPHVTFFRPGPDRILNLSLPVRDYNPEQIKAISCGLSVVRGHDRTPKICLIHGPPGTGKSRTIVGLLQRLFSEGVENLRSTSSCHTRAPKLRVLLCTPSNAAIDSLMKKIILVFKDSCRDRQNPQGNCGDINLVRLGLEKTISKHLKPFSLDNQTRSRTHEKYKLLKEREQLGRRLRETRSRRQETQAKVLQDAHIICCTLSTSGSVLLESAFRRLGHKPFSCVIVDEAGQATETETLIPLLYRCPALILVGDPEQLPPTVVSQTAKEKRYDQSLMARLRKCLHGMGKGNPQMNNPVIFLNRQYRMHPDICEFPSKYIYNRELMTDDETAQKRCAVNWPFQPYRLFDVTDGREFCKLNVWSATCVFFRVEVDTVDGFQGREMDCVIVSCVRASSELGSIGFLGNRQRLNVTITRAKSSLFILGHLRTLKEQKDWGALIDDACKRGTIIKTSENYFRKHAMQIFKPEGLRGLSSKVPSLPFRVGSAEGGPFRQRAESMCAATTFAGRAEDRPAPIHSHRMSDPLPLCDVKKASAPAQPPVRPTAAERPRDPRLSVWTETSTVWPPHTRSEGHDDAVSPQDPAPLPQDPSPAPVVQCRKEPSHFSGYSSSRERHQQPQQRSYEWGYRDPRQSGPDRQTSSGSSYPSQYPYSQMIKRSSDSQYTAAPSAKRQK
uniref:Senataxin n=1 Tax=Scleropages formosus TaxID=113540 RepID=A0A8C9WLD3_SCLFO